MAQNKVDLVRGDNNIKLIWNIKKDDRIESLLGATIKLQFIERNTNVVLKRECVITDASTAECMYVITQEDTSVVGSYLSEMEIEYSNGTILKYQNPIILIVRPEIVEG
jgi:hypothetical protein